MDIFLEKLEFFANNKELIKLVVSNKQNKKSDLKKVIIKLVKLKNDLKLSFVYNHDTKDITKNFEINEGLIIIKKLLKTEFFNADMFSINETIQLISNKKGNVKIKTTEPTFKAIPELNHDRIKKQRISSINNIYLQELGIVAKNGKILKDKHDKFKQINKYLETIETLIIDKNITSKSLINIVDMGSGKGYLTFALYDFLTNGLNFDVQITGVEFRQDLVDTCNGIAKKSNFKNLNFRQGTIEKSEFKKIDILIALHACDTATDEAIYQGIKHKSELIIVAPCCQKQIRKQFNVTNEMSSILKFGILKERQAELITDGIRALILEYYGYKTKVFEFISTEHTPKNVMIAGTKVSSEKDNEYILEKIKFIKSFYGIKFHYLEKLLKII